MNDLQIFKNEAFGEVRVAEVEGEPYFCLADICRVLDLQVGATKNRLDQKGVNLINTLTRGGSQDIIYVSEKNLYKVIMRSDKPQAESFQDWVCGEVLPSIRKHGTYMTEQVQEKALQDPDFLIKLATNLKEERQKCRIAESKLALEQQINETNAPKVNFANAIVGCKSSCLIGELAKIITQNGTQIGQNRLFQWLRDNGYLGTKGERYNIPNQKYVEQGLFEVKKGVRSGNDGVMITTTTTKITGKGQLYFVNKFLHTPHRDI